MNQPAPSGPPGPARTVPPEEAGPGEQEPKSKGGRSFLAELPILIIIAFVLALLLKTFLVQAFFIPSSSMEPTLAIGDRVLVNKLSYRIRDPRRGELAVFTQRDELAPDQSFGDRVVGFLSSGLGFARPDERDFIKRIIGLPGETIEMRGGVVYIDGEPLPESPSTEGGYLSSVDLADFGPLEVPEGHYFMMGDNRPNSADSRYSLGPIDEDDLVGRAFVVIWPLGHFDTLPIWDYAAAEGTDTALEQQGNGADRVTATPLP